MLLRNWNVVCWNVRGLNAPEKHLALGNAINTSGCAIVCLQESKMPFFDAAVLKSIFPRHFDQFAYIPSQGASGGIITVWNSSIFTGRVFLSENFALGIEFTSTQSNHCWKLVNVYGPCQGEHRVTFTNWLFVMNIPADDV